MVTATFLCTIIGLVGGGILNFVLLGSWTSALVLGGIYGLLFPLLFRARSNSPGAGLIWGLAYAFLLWLVVAGEILPAISNRLSSNGMLETCRSAFPELVGYILCIGAPLGLALGTMQTLRTPHKRHGGIVSFR